MKKYFWVIVAIILVVFVVASVPKNEETSVSKDVRTIKIGVAAGLTGYAAEWGEGELSAIKLVVDEFNEESKNSHIDIIVEDTKSDAAGTTNAIKKLIEIDKVEAIIGPTWGDSFQGGFPIATAAKVWTIAPSAALETVGEKKKDYPYLLSLWWPQKDEIGAMQNFISSKGYVNVAVVTDKDAFNVLMGSDFAKAAPARNINIVASEATPIGATDFRTVITKLKNLKPDAILVLMQDTSQLGPFSKQVKELGLTSKSGENPKILSTASAENQSNLDTFPGLFDGMYYTSPAISEDNLYKRYLEEHKKTTNNKPTGPSFVNALNAARAVVVAVEMREDAGGVGMLPLDKVKTPGIGIEEIEFNSNGQILKSEFLIKTVRDNKFEVVK